MEYPAAAQADCRPCSQSRWSTSSNLGFNAGVTSAAPGLSALPARAGGPSLGAPRLSNRELELDWELRALSINLNTGPTPGFTPPRSGTKGQGETD